MTLAPPLTLQELLRNAADLYRQKNWLELDQLSAEGLREYPGDRQLLGIRQACLCQAGNHEEAAAVLLQFLQRHPDDREALKWLKDIVLAHSFQEEAVVDQFRRLHNLPGMLLTLRVHVNRRDGASAVQLYQEIAAKWPERTELQAGDFADFLLEAQV